MYLITSQAAHVHKAIRAIRLLRVVEHQCSNIHKIHAIRHRAEQMDCAAYRMVPLYALVKPA